MESIFDPALGKILESIRSKTNRFKDVPLHGDSKDVLDRLLALSADPYGYNTAQEYFIDRQFLHLVKKMDTGDRSVLQKHEEKAIEAFYELEQVCYVTNAKFTRLQQQHFTCPAEVKIFQFLEESRLWIKRVLGRCPEAEDIGFYYGPGGAVGLRGKHSNLLNKLTTDQNTITQDCLAYMGSEVFRLLPVRNSQSVILKDTSVFTTVPKDSSKRRPINIEPVVNMGFQLGVGKILKAKLRNFGYLDRGVNDPQHVHKIAARQASVTKKFATIDLSNASDTICRELVKYLLPADWFRLLDSLRTKFTEVDSKVVRLEKFSSMGNGFTFELETLIFASLCYAICGIKNSVFGDDMIVPDESYKDLSALLNYCGLTVNDTKSFYGDSKFRESCGGDYFDGISVRPFYIKKTPQCPMDWIVIANGLRRAWSQDRDLCNFCDHPLYEAWQLACEQIPRNVRLFGPEFLGDAVIHTDDWNSYGAHNVRTSGYGCPTHVKGLVPYGRKDKWENYENSKYVFNLYAAAPAHKAGEFDSGVAPRDSISGYKTKWFSLVNPDSLSRLYENSTSLRFPFLGDCGVTGE